MAHQRRNPIKEGEKERKRKLLKFPIEILLWMIIGIVTGLVQKMMILYPLILLIFWIQCIYLFLFS
jgi:hypothetical protein